MKTSTIHNANFMKCCFLAIILLMVFKCTAQNNATSDSAISSITYSLSHTQAIIELNVLCDSIDQQIGRGQYKYYTLNSEKRKIDREGRLSTEKKWWQNNKIKNWRIKRLKEKIASIDQTRHVINKVVVLLVKYENQNNQFSYDNLSSGSLAIIQSIHEINMLEILLRTVEDHKINDSLGVGMNSVMQVKLEKAISLQMDILAKRNFVWYNYATDKKQIFDAINFNTANDLFTPVGFSEFFGYKPKTNANFLQGNDDRDYTGGVMFEVATNYLKIRRQRPVKSYQTVSWGGDFYSPYFRDSLKFPTSTSFNKQDRPFASFQYYGYATHCLSRNNGFRWDISFEFGKIGGKRGQVIQSVIHQDLSYSPRPLGWDAQIAQGGRLGFSMQYKPEWILKCLSIGEINGVNTKRSLFTSLSGDLMFGNYMTYASAGLQFSNKNFSITNSDNAILRNQHSIKRSKANWFPFLMWNLRLNSRYVVHNTMLEGYGTYKTTEPDWNAPRTDSITPYSKYFLYKNQVKRVVWSADFTISKQARYFTFFYRFSIISPETNLGKIGIKDKTTGIEYDLTNRWHHWATLGVCFRVE